MRVISLTPWEAGSFHGVLLFMVKYWKTGFVCIVIGQKNGGNYFDYQAPNGGGYQCRLAGKGSMIRLKELQKMLR